MKFIKDKKGFTLVELVVVIAILGILAGIAIPRFMEATKSARGAKIVADMRTIESAVNVYYIQTGAYPTDTTTAPTGGKSLADIANGGTWPVPPKGTFAIAHTVGAAGVTTGTIPPTAGTYTYTKGTDSAVDAGKVTLTGATGLAGCAGGTTPTVSQLLGGAATTTPTTEDNNG